MKEAILDGEITALDTEGRQYFRDLLAGRGHLHYAASTRSPPSTLPAVKCFAAIRASRSDKRAAAAGEHTFHPAGRLIEDIELVRSCRA